MSDQQNEQLENNPSGIAESYEVNLDQLFNKKPEYHIWRQRGPFLVCTSCPFSHQAYIGNDRKLIGQDKKGNPILKSKAS